MGAQRAYTTGARTICEADVAATAPSPGTTAPSTPTRSTRKTPCTARPIVPGGLTFIIANGLDCQTLWVDGAISAFWTSRCASSGPVHVGDTICLTMTPTAKRLSKKPGRGIITYRICVFNQRDEMVMDGTWVILMATDRDHME